MSDIVQLVLKGLTDESPNYHTATVSPDDVVPLNDAWTQTERSHNIVLFDHGFPFLSPIVTILYLVNTAIHFWAYAAFVRRANVSNSTGGAYLFFSAIGLILLPGAACLPMIASVTRPMSIQKTRRLRLFASGILAALSALPLFFLDVSIYVDLGFDKNNAWQVTALVLSILTGVYVPWMLYVEYCVDRVHVYGLNWKPT